MMMVLMASAINYGVTILLPSEEGQLRHLCRVAEEYQYHFLGLALSRL